MRHAGILFCLVFLVACTGAEEEGEILETDLSERPQRVVTSTDAEVGADAGFISDGGSISIPTGFAASQCVFTAALAHVSGSALSSRVQVNTETGEVTCKTVVQEEGSAPTEKGCVASYTVICAK